MGHVAVAVDARECWGEELLIVYGGLSEEKYALDDLIVLQAGSAAWFHPEVPKFRRPPARAFHCGAAIGKKVYIFGGHVWLKEMRGLQKFNDLWSLDTVRLVKIFTSKLHDFSIMLRHVPTAGFLSYILAQDTWEWAPVELPQTAQRPSPRDFAAMSDLSGGRLLLFGGLDASEKRLDDTWIFDTMT